MNAGKCTGGPYCGLYHQDMLKRFTIRKFIDEVKIRLGHYYFKDGKWIWEGWNKGD